VGASFEELNLPKEIFWPHSLSLQPPRRCDIQGNSIQHNDSQHNNSQQDSIRQNDAQHSEMSECHPA
jgi:hypothetical protein